MSCDGGSSCTRHWRRYGTHVRSPSWLREYKYRMTEKGGKRYGRIASDLIDDGIARAEGSRPYTNYSCTTQRVGMKGAGCRVWRWTGITPFASTPDSAASPSWTRRTHPTPADYCTTCCEMARRASLCSHKACDQLNVYLSRYRRRPAQCHPASMSHCCLTEHSTTRKPERLSQSPGRIHA